MLYFYLEDFIVNAIIELDQINGTRKILIKTADTYGEEVMKNLRQKGYHAQKKTMNERAISTFEEKYACYFMEYTEKSEKGYLLKENISIETLKQKFRKNFTSEIISAFSDPIIIEQTINPNQYFNFQKENQESSRANLCPFFTGYTLSSSSNSKKETSASSEFLVHCPNARRLVKKRREQSSVCYKS